MAASTLHMPPRTGNLGKKEHRITDGSKQIPAKGRR